MRRGALAAHEAEDDVRGGNLANVQAVYDSFAAGDIDAVLGALDPEVEWVTPATLPWSCGTYRGPAGVGEYLASFGAALEDASVEPEELIAADGRVVAVGYERATARSTGARFAARFVHMWMLRDGKVVRMEGVPDTAAIRAAFEVVREADASAVAAVRPVFPSG